jgi:hypothetical protein
MKRKLVLAALGALLAVGTAWTSQAQTNVITQTNVTLDLDFYLSTVAQGTVTTNDDGAVVNGVVFGNITEASIISELGASTSNNFSRHAELWLVIPIAAPADWSVKVRDGTNSPVDVTGFFTYVPGTNSVGKTVVSTTGGVSDTEYSIDRFGLHDQAGLPALSIHFDVSGFTITTTRGIVPTAGSELTGETESINACVDGTGEQDGNLIIIEGIVTARNNEGFPHPIPVFAGDGHGDGDGNGRD